MSTMHERQHSTSPIFQGLVTGDGGKMSYIHLVCNIRRELSSDLDSYSRNKKDVTPFSHSDSVWACFPSKHHDWQGKLSESFGEAG